MTWTCTKCAVVFKTYGRAQTHANAAHHGARITLNVATRKRP